MIVHVSNNGVKIKTMGTSFCCPHLKGDGKLGEKKEGKVGTERRVERKPDWGKNVAVRD